MFSRYFLSWLDDYGKVVDSLAFWDDQVKTIF